MESWKVEKLKVGNALENSLIFLPEHWGVIRDVFYEIDPIDRGINEERKNYDLFHQEDLLYLKKIDFHLDLGWYGGDKNGFFGLHLFKGADWHNCQLLEKRNTTNYQEVIELINQFIENVDQGKYTELDLQSREVYHYNDYTHFTVLKH